MPKDDILEKKISLLKEVADTIISTGNADSIANLIIDLALNYINAKAGSILLLDSNNELAVIAARGMEPSLISALRLKIGENICGQVALERRPLLVKDIEQDDRVKKKGGEKYRTKSFICCPILMKDKILGVINISDKTDGTIFTEDELDLISILANQAAIALENARLMSELVSKTVELDEINKGLIEADRVKTEFIARMSHELRTPLNSINGAVYYLRERKGSKEEQREFIEIISSETIKLITLLEGLLDFSRLEKEEYLLKKKVVNINDIITDVIATKSVKDILRGNNCSMMLSLKKDISNIVGDRTRIFQLFINLIDGFVKYVSAGDVIALNTSETANDIEVGLLIKDRQINESELAYLFDSRALWSLPDIPTNSLKFYLAKKTVELHKGAISVKNTQAGFSITFVMPKNIKERREVEIKELMNLCASFTAKSMSLNKCSLMLKDNLTGELTIKGAYGIDEEIIKRTRLRIGDQIAGWVAVEKKPLLVKDIEKEPRIGKANGLMYSTKSLLCLPVKVGDEVMGVLNLSNKQSNDIFDTKDLYLATAITTRISHILEKLYASDVNEKDLKIISKGIDTLLNAEDKYKKQNNKLLDLVYLVMQRLACKEDETSLALYAAMLYDIGLTQIDDSILQKDQTLTTLEQRIIRTHPISGAGLVDHLEFTDTIKKIILHHHEKFDGSGYPEGLKEDNIPLISRVLAVIDAYMSMTSNQPYRKAFSEAVTVSRIKAESGKQFDPNVVNAFLQVASELQT